MPNARVDQFLLEMVLLSQPNARVDQFVLELAISPEAPGITCGNPPNGEINEFYTHTFPTTGGLMPFVFSITVPLIPPGLTLDSSTGVLSGVPIAAGLYNFTVAVTDANLLSASVACSILIIGGPLKITLRGVNRRKACAEDISVTEVPAAPNVKRAV